MESTSSRPDQKFVDLEKRLVALSDQLANQEITPEEYKQAIQTLTVKDNSGQTWWLAGQPGAWRHWDGKNWVQANPNSHSPTKSKHKPILGILLILTAILLLCTCMIGFGYFMMRDQIGNFFRQDDIQRGLNLDPRGADGRVSGIYQSESGAAVHFHVTVDGTAFYRLDGKGELAKLDIALQDEQSARMDWYGYTLDGFGELSSEELSALANLMASDLAEGITMIPLDIACVGNDQIDRKQLAALLFPLQMSYKYQVSDRLAKATELMASSSCNYDNLSQTQDFLTTQIYLTPANTVPVVFGYFPFDGEGAVGATRTQISGGTLACSDPSLILSFNNNIVANVQELDNPNDSEIIFNEYGPCTAMCRGACGPDCPPANCSKTKSSRCLKDELGNNTGESYQTYIYECGLHPACIKHDACYDECNTIWGCETWEATFCRHGGYHTIHNPLLTIVEYYRGNYFCDMVTVSEENLIDVWGWVDGYGPQPITQVFEYTDQDAWWWKDPTNCPIKAVEDEEDADNEAEEMEEVEEVMEEPPEPVITRYKGHIELAEGQLWLELDNSNVEFEVIDEILTATISMTFTADLKMNLENEVVCTATMTRVYTGEAPFDENLEIVLTLDSHEDIYLGSDCVDVFAPVIREQTLNGEFFEDGNFYGTIRNVWVIYVTKVSE